MTRAIRDQTGNQIMLLKHITESDSEERPGSPERAADSEVFNIDDKQTRAVSSPDLTKIATSRKTPAAPLRHEFKLMNNDGQLIYDIKQRKKEGDGGREAGFGVLDANGREVASIDEEEEAEAKSSRSPRVWLFKDPSGRSVAFSNLKIKESSGTVTVPGRGEWGSSETLKSVAVQGWETNPPTVDLPDRFTIVSPRLNNKPIAQVYPGTTSEGGKVGRQTSDALEVIFNPSSMESSTGATSEDEEGSSGRRNAEPQLILCFALVLDYISRRGLRA